MKVTNLVVLSTLFVLSCTGTQYSKEADKIIDVGTSFGSSNESTEALVGFCSDFGNPELNQKIETTLSNNFDLKSGWARLEQSMAASRSANSTLWPTITADASAGRARSAAPAPIGAVESNNFRVGLGAAYEIDLWGRLKHQRAAAENDVLAARDDFESLAISTVAQTSLAWFDVAHQRQKRALLERQLKTSEKFLELTELRLNQGVSGALDITQQRQQVESTRGQLALIEASEKTAITQLAILLGQTPSTFDSAAVAELPQLPSPPAVGLPADLLENRPDLRAARRRLASADSRTAAAASAYLPSLRLSASTFLQAANIGDLIDEIFWSISGAISQNVFQGGKRNADVDASQAAARSQLYAYGQAVLRALKDVEDAMVREKSQESFVKSLTTQLNDAQTGLDISRTRYQSGAGDYLRVLNALQSVQRLETSLLDAQKLQFTYRVQLCRSLGGGWTRELDLSEAKNTQEPQ